MARMAGHIGLMLSVPMLGSSRISQKILLILTICMAGGMSPRAAGRGQAGGTSWPGRQDGRRSDRGRPDEQEATMASGVVLIVAAGIFSFFVAGAVLGVIIAVAVAVRREDRRLSLTGRAPDRLASGARRLNGVGTRDITEEPWRRSGDLVRQ